MSSPIIKHAVYSVIILLVQVLILNNLNFGGFINPFLYLAILLIMPMDVQNWIIVPVGFVVGIIIDSFLNTVGVHASAAVLLAYTRPYLLRYLAPREGYEAGSQPVPSQFGALWFFKYITLAVLMHHLYLFFIEAFTFQGIFLTLWRAVISTVFTVAIIMLVQFFSDPGKKRS